MKKMPPWASGPGEILRHGFELLKKDSDINRRLAMILIDNAVELTMKTYLGLPQRITGLRISRSEYAKLSESFPRLLDALENYAADKIRGMNLGEIEWFHRIRNELYHQGNGLTVARDIVQIYATLANLLFKNLFGVRLVEPETEEGKHLADFMESWVTLETTLAETLRTYDVNVVKLHHGRPSIHYHKILANEGFISAVEYEKLIRLAKIRNSLIWDTAAYKNAVDPGIVRELRNITYQLRNKLRRKKPINEPRCTESDKESKLPRPKEENGC